MKWDLPKCPKCGQFCVSEKHIQIHLKVVHKEEAEEEGKEK